MKILLHALLALSPFLTVAAASPPNVLLIVADDCTFSDLPFHGGENARTPRLSRLAEQGLVFDRASVGMAMGSPSRSELYTGQTPLRNGCAWNHGTCRPGTRSLPHHLGALGYRVGLAGKTHIRPAEVFPFEKVPGFDRTLVERFLKRPSEELYHTAHDRFEMTNLAADPAHAATKARLSAELDRHYAGHHDPGAVLDSPASFDAAAGGKHSFPAKP